MIVKTLLAFVAIVGAFLGYVALKPADFQISREIRIAASADAIYPYLNNPKKMDTWNPWTKIDPQVKMAYSGPEAGVGAVSSWEGNKDIGAGSSTIVESVPNRLVRSRLDFLKPFKSTSMTDFTLTQEGAQTVVKWSMSGKSPFIPRVFCTLMTIATNMDMDKMVGGNFEKGLAELKTIVEKPIAQN
jgi:hypothetical protein